MGKLILYQVQSWINTFTDDILEIGNCTNKLYNFLGLVLLLTFFLKTIPTLFLGGDYQRATMIQQSLMQWQTENAASESFAGCFTMCSQCITMSKKCARNTAQTLQQMFYNLKQTSEQGAWKCAAKALQWARNVQQM